MDGFVGNTGVNSLVAWLGIVLVIVVSSGLTDSSPVLDIGDSVLDVAKNGASNAIPKFDCHSEPATLSPRWTGWLINIFSVIRGSQKA